MDRTDNTNPSRTSNPREQLVSGERQNGYSGPVVPHSSSHLPLQSANHTNPPPPLPNLPNATSSATYAQPAVFANDDWEAHEAALILLSFSRQAFAESLEMTNSDTDVNQHETIADSSSNPDQLSTSAVHPSSSLQADSSPPGSEDYDSDETEYQHKIQHPEASSLEDPTSANMANIHESSSKEYTAEDRNKRPVPPWMPERQHYVDRSMTTTMTREELHDKEYRKSLHIIVLQTKEI